jgi:hypothetical protein
LLDAARNGELSTSEGVATQARRMLKDAKARGAFGRFALQWLDIRDIENAPKDKTAFPTFSSEIATAMAQESIEFAAATVFDKDATLKTLMAGKTTNLNQTLSQFYGFGQVSGAAFKEVATPEFKAGILSHGAFLVSHSGEGATSPIKTGTFVRRRLMCHFVGAPPPTAPTTVDPPTGGQTVKDLFNQNAKSGCKGCHQLLNPIGFGFENLDAVGRTRTQFIGLPIDSSGEIVSQDQTTSRSFGAGTGVYDTLSTMPDVSNCFTLRMFQFAMGRTAGTQDKAILDALAQRFRAEQPRIDELMVSIVSSPAFLTRDTTSP